MKVYLLQHGSDVASTTDVKVLGIYSSRAEADEARSRAVALPGFRDAPKGFSIDPYELGADYWERGFVSVRNHQGVPDGNDEVSRALAPPEAS